MEYDPQNIILFPFLLFYYLYLFYLFFNVDNLFVLRGLPGIHKEWMVGVDVRRKAQWAVNGFNGLENIHSDEGNQGMMDCNTNFVLGVWDLANQLWDFLSRILQWNRWFNFIKPWAKLCIPLMLWWYFIPFNFTKVANVW